MFALIASFAVSSFAGDWGDKEPVGKETVFYHEKWHGTANFDAITGSRNIGQLDFTMPLKQNENSMLFFDFRGWTDDDDVSEYNVGLAYRKIVGYKIVGLYGFFDRHYSEPSGNQFNQFTIGGEILKENGEQRFNAYFPTSLEGKGTGFGNLSIRGNRIFAAGLEERAYIGFDYEAGRLVHTFGVHDNEVRVYGGGFFFDNDAAGFETIVGPRIRVETRLFDVAMLGEGSRVTLSGELTWDQVRDTRAFAGIGVQIPIGKWGKHQLGNSGGKSPIGDSSYGSLSRLERRMYDPIIRDRDVVTATSGNELVNDAENDPLFVASSEFDLDEQIRNAGVNGTVVVNGTIVTPGGHQLLPGMRLAGANSIQGITGTTTGQMIITRLPGSNGFLKGTDSSTPVVLLANSTTVDSLSINGGWSGIFGQSVSNIKITNNTIIGAIEESFGISGDDDGSGVVILDGFSGLISHNVFANNESNGLYVGTNNGTISNNTTRGNGDDGIDLEGDNNGTISWNLSISDDDEGIEVHGDNNGTISGNTVRMSGDNGIEVGGANNGLIDGNTVTMAADDGFDLTDNFGTISNNTANNNGDDGIDLDGDNFGTIINNTANNNAVDGFSIFDNAGLIAWNSASGNEFDGFYIDGDNLVGGVIRNNTATNNREDGFDVFDNFGLITQNTATGNTFDGFYLDNNNEGTISNNTSSGNGEDGISMFDNNGLISGNTSTGNAFDGIYVDNDNNGTITKNTATNNEGSGFVVANANTGTISNNTATGNDLFGYSIFTNDAAGVVSNNKATGNGFAGFIMDTNSGSMTSNTATSNEAGFALDLNEGDFSSNIASSNTLFGFGATGFGPALTENDGTFDFNQALNNGGAGFEVMNDAGTDTGNVSSGNGAADVGDVP